MLKGACLGYPRYQAVLTEEVADLEGVVPSKAYCRLIQMYGYHIHHNNSSHMEGGIADNHIYQVRWRLLVSHP